jgi:hypothetical protein
MFHKLFIKEMPRSDMPMDAQERMMVPRWVRREETNPDASKAGKYPTEIKKKKLPACPWLSAKSFSMAGNKGARMILDVKLIKKINARKRTGPT